MDTQQHSNIEDDLDETSPFSLPGADDIEESTNALPDMDEALGDEEIEIETGKEVPIAAKAETGEEEEAPLDDEVSRYKRVAEEQEQRAVMAEANAIMREAQAEAKAVQAHADGAKVGLDTLDYRLKEARRNLKSARDNGDSDGEVELEALIGSMTALRSEIETKRASLPTPDAIVQHARNTAETMVRNAQRTGTQINDTTRAMNPQAEKWAKANAWMADPGHAQAHNYVVSASAHMAKNGWDPKSPSFFAELTKRVSANFPNLKAAAPQAAARGTVAPKAGVRTPVAPARSSSGAAPAVRKTADGKAVFRMSPSEYSAMERQKLDPRNPAHRKAWATSRIESAKRSAS